MRKTKRIIVYGAGQIGNMVLSILDLVSNIEIAGFVDDNVEIWGKKIWGYNVLGGRDYLECPKEAYDGVILALGVVEARVKVGRIIRELGIEQINAIHPSAIISTDVKLGYGNIIGAGVNLFVNPAIGNNVFIGPGVIVSHDTFVGDYALLSVGSVIGARVTLEEGAFIGAGATVMPTGWGEKSRLLVGKYSIVGVGSVVIRDVKAYSVVAGSPVRLLRYRKKE